LAFFQSDFRCTACKNWVTLYVTAEDKPSSKAAFRYTCACGRVISGEGGSFASAKNIPFSAIVAELVPA
jgi:hypothetical protein